MELFQLDQPDLDFGIYRILHARSAEISKFLDEDLLPQVRTALEAYQPADRAALAKEIAELRASVERAGMDPDQSPKMKELQERFSESVDVSQIEGSIYDHLFSFFRRYYSEGDFLSKRVYKDGVYAIPYSGEEVKLHWANADQYYIKTSEYLRDYAFRLRAGDDADPMRVHFRLVDATEGEHGNVKAAEGKGRVFVLAGGDFMTEEEGELVIRFEYRPSTPADARDGGASDEKPPVQKELLALATDLVLACPDPALARWVKALGEAHVRAGGEVSTDSRLRVHLDRYTRRNTFDYFIHKDLGGFLRRELDFYIKNEVMRLDDIENETAARVEQYLSKIKVIRRIAGAIIDFLAQIEDFQKKLWLKKKFVVETSYCITLGIIPEDFYPEIAANDAQREEWVKLLAIDEIEGTLASPGYSVPLTVEFLKAHPTLLVDTRYCAAPLAEKLVAALGDLGEHCDGLVVEGENSQALSALKAQSRGRVKCVYLDPPYNTGKDDFPYKDGYQSSSWLSMMRDRVQACADLMRSDGALFTSIDGTEFRHLGLLLDEVLGRTSDVGSVVWRNARDNNPTRVAVEHEYVACRVQDIEKADAVWKNDFAEPKELLLAEYERLRADGRSLDNIQQSLRRFIRDNVSVLKEVDRYKFVDETGVFTGSQSVHNPHPGGYEYPIFHPNTGGTMRMPANGYRFPETTMVRDFLEKGRIIFGPDEHRIVQIKVYLKDYRDSFRSVLDLDGRLGSYALSALFGRQNGLFDNAKPPQLLRRLFSFASSPGSIVLDPFAGSGTTAQSVIEISRMTDLRMSFMLVEMGHFVDSVLMPRVKKVAFAPDWKDGKPRRPATAEEAERGPRVVKVVRLESYEDALNNLDLRRSEPQQRILSGLDGRVDAKFREQYFLKYMLDVESRGSASLLNISAFTDPTAYVMKVKRPGSDESRVVNVDLLETFNWLIGLTVRRIAAPRTYSAAIRRDDEQRLRLDGELVEDSDGPFWFRSVTGTLPDGRRALVAWRKRPGGDDPEGIERDNLILDEWFAPLLDRARTSEADQGFDVVYVNGDSNLESLRNAGETWAVRLIEEDFLRLMFDTEGM